NLILACDLKAFARRQKILFRDWKISGCENFPGDLRWKDHPAIQTFSHVPFRRRLLRCPERRHEGLVLASPKWTRQFLRSAKPDVLTLIRRPIIFGSHFHTTWPLKTIICWRTCWTWAMRPISRSTVGVRIDWR